MKMNPVGSFCIRGIVVLVLLAAVGCEAPQRTGFLSDYSRLEKDGLRQCRARSPTGITSGGYSSETGCLVAKPNRSPEVNKRASMCHVHAREIVITGVGESVEFLRKLR